MTLLLEAIAKVGSKPKWFTMLETRQDTYNSAQHGFGALSRWDNEGGAGPNGSHAPDAKRPDDPPLSDVEIVQLRVRLIALENLVIALLAHSPNQVLNTGREMANYILPKPGAAQHWLTTHAATHMIDLIERSKHFQVD